jgi:threonine dehydrogenase-like Zn-dependent dehydrogenase
MMCSSATAYHAIRKSRLSPGETVAVFGVGGLGLSAVQLAFVHGASRVFAVDLRESKLQAAAQFGAIPIHPHATPPSTLIREQTGGRGVDVSLELAGSPGTMREALMALAIGGRAALAGITPSAFSVYPYAELINREAELIGVSDHLAQELPSLLEFARSGKLDLGKVITRKVPLSAEAINEALDNLEEFGNELRIVVTP